MKQTLGIETITFTATRRYNEDVDVGPVLDEISAIPSAAEFPVVKNEAESNGVVWLGGDERIGNGRGILIEHPEPGVLCLHTTFGGAQDDLFGAAINEIIDIADFLVVNSATTELTLSLPYEQLTTVPTACGDIDVSGIRLNSGDHTFMFEASNGETTIEVQRRTEATVENIADYLSAETETMVNFITGFVP